ncbi:MAG: glycosyltransferase [Planctomycetia bacterium]|nr:glycosyltransferase [Planctomycetia bacterium]
MSEKELRTKTLSRSVPPLAVVLETRVVTGNGGGPEKTILNTPRYMTRYGFKTLCAYMYSPDDPGFPWLKKRAAELDCPLIGVEDRGAFDWQVVRRMLQICRENQVTFWHGHDYKSNFLGLYLRRYYPMKLISTVHGWVHRTWKTPIYYALDRWCLKHYDYVFCVSQDLYTSCLKLGIPSSQCSLLENGIDVYQYSRTMSLEKAKKRWHFPLKRLVVGSMGRLSPEKNFAGLIRAVGKLILEGNPISLYIAGEGPLRESLQRQIDHLGVSEFIHLIGYREDVLDFFQGLDAFVLNSFREGLPNVLLEAMALEVPVISTRIAGIPNLIVNGYNGILVTPDKDEELEQMIKTLYREKDYREMLALNGRYTVSTEFTMEDRMEKIRNIYRRILEKDDPTYDRYHDPWELL